MGLLSISIVLDKLISVIVPRIYGKVILINGVNRVNIAIELEDYVKTVRENIVVRVKKPITASSFPRTTTNYIEAEDILSGTGTASSKIKETLGTLSISILGVSNKENWINVLCNSINFEGDVNYFYLETILYSNRNPTNDT